MTKKAGFAGILTMVLVFGLTVIGCQTTAPILYTDNPKKDFSILGQVTYTSSVFSNFQKNGFSGLLDAARKKYPDCDYVIDVMIDKKRTVILFFVINNYEMTGTAIKYIKE